MSAARDFGSRFAEPKGVRLSMDAPGVTGFKPWFMRQLAPAARENTLCFRVRCAGAPYTDLSPRQNDCVARLTATAAPAQPVRCAVAHSSPRPVVSRNVVACVEILSVPIWFFFVPLTPARSSAINMDAQMLARQRAGGLVASATACNQNCNRLSIEIAAYFSLVARLHSLARVYHVTRVCERARMCVGLKKAQPPQPLQPIQNMHVYLNVSGCASGCTEMASATSDGGARALSAAERSFSRETNCLMGGYSGALVARSFLIPPSSLKPAPEAKNFRALARDGRQLGGRICAGLRSGRNGGNQPFLRGARGHVGRVMLEGMAQSLGFRAFQRSGHMIANHMASPIAQAESPPLVDLADAPLSPPLARRLGSSPLAPEAFQISFALLNAGHGAGMRNSGIGRAGSGVMRRAGSHGEPWRGRGKGRCSGGDVRRSVRASVGGARVKQG